jgi:septum formation protein
MKKSSPGEAFHILLASGSPRRADLLRQAGFKLSVHTSGVEEHVPTSRTVQKLVVENAVLKGKDVLARIDLSLFEEDTVLIAADTLVVRGEHVFGKPQTIVEAKRMLRNLALVPHEVLTGVYMRWIGREKEFQGFTRTEVTLISMDDHQLDTLFKKCNPLDKAGGYGYQDSPEIVKQRKGSTTNVIGLPMETVQHVLNSWMQELV